MVQKVVIIDLNVSVKKDLYFVHPKKIVLDIQIEKIAVVEKVVILFCILLENEEKLKEDKVQIYKKEVVNI